LVGLLKTVIYVIQGTYFGNWKEIGEKVKRILVVFSLLASVLSSCQPTASQVSGPPRVLAVESFLADIAQNVAGDRLTVQALIPLGVDPHAYQPTPQDAAKITDVDVLIQNGANLEAFLAPILQNAGGNQIVISASSGLTPRPDPSGEHPEGDPHFWLDPNNVIKYAENIRDGLSQVDPAGMAIYTDNTNTYIMKLQALDVWIMSQVQNVPLVHRQLVTNHETFGYFAERYRFSIIGAILPSISSGAASSAQEMAALIDAIRSTGTTAIFLENGSNSQLADQIATETGVKVITGLYTHSLGTPNGPAGTYIEMMKYDVSIIVEALK
jgi:ABC-type Zn uptake system ZnuABC Zn-binding protein ZnuA